MYSVSVRLLWPTANTGFLHLLCRWHVRLVRCCDEFQFVFGSAHPERVLLYCCPSGEHLLQTSMEHVRPESFRLGWLDVRPGQLLRNRQPVPKSRLLRLIGVEQWRGRHLRQTFLQALMRPVIAISKLPVLLGTIYYFLNFAWIIGVNATISIWLTTFYKFTPYNLGTSHFPPPFTRTCKNSNKRTKPLTPTLPPGFFYFAPIISALLGAFLGHWLHDSIGTYYTRRHVGHIEPEARPIIIWLASPIMAVSILVLGFALQHA